MKQKERKKKKEEEKEGEKLMYKKMPVGLPRI